MKLGSLFDGSGGFPLAGRLNGIETAWLSEIAPYPCAVTKKNFPDVPNLGDVRNIDGSKIEPVDIITMGSPCQDMSLNGQRKGLEGKNSSLFFEGIRIIKEMKKATNNLFPRYILWENVWGAISSKNGDDFHQVLDQFLSIIGFENVVPKSLWPNQGLIDLDTASLAWRLFNSKYWGVPQSRHRIYLVFDTAGRRAPEILFDTKRGELDPLLQK